MRFCVFCGEKLPEQAVFCPSCGSRQPQEAKAEEPIVEKEEPEEDDSSNIALSLLSKANFVSKKNNKPVVPPYEPKRAKRVNENGDIIEENPRPETKEPEMGAAVISTPSIKKMEEINNQAPELQIKVEYDDGMDEEDAREMAQMMEMMNRGTDSYTPPILSDITEEIRENKVAENYEEIAADEKAKEQNAEKEPEVLPEEKLEEPATDIPKEKPKTEETPVQAAPSPKRSRSSRPARPSRPSYKKRNYSPEDESEKEDRNAVRPMNMNSTLGSGDNSELTADEIADIEKYKKYKESGQEKEDREESGSVREGRTAKGEGRKAVGRKKEIRRNIDKEISERDIREIQHEEIENKNDVDKDYDGYYENVKAIDFDKMHDNSAVMKTVLTAGAVIVMACVVFYFVFSFFLQ